MIKYLNKRKIINFSSRTDLWTIYLEISEPQESEKSIPTSDTDFFPIVWKVAFKNEFGTKGN